MHHAMGNRHDTHEDCELDEVEKALAILAERRLPDLFCAEVLDPLGSKLRDGKLSGEGVSALAGPPGWQVVPQTAASHGLPRLLRAH